VTSIRALASRALLPAASAVSVETGWASTDPRPSWASAPPGSLSVQRGNAFHIPSALDLPPPGTPDGWPSASCRYTDWLAWNQAADPLELSGLNPRPSFRKVGFEACFSGLTANRINLFNASGPYIAFDMMF